MASSQDIDPKAPLHPPGTLPPAIGGGGQGPSISAEDIAKRFGDVPPRPNMPSPAEMRGESQYQFNPPPQPTPPPETVLTARTDEGTAPYSPSLEQQEYRSTPAPGSVGAVGVRMDPPSNYVFYDFKDLHVRRFRVPDLSRIYAAQKNGDISMLGDALGATISVDIRELTAPDFFFTMYWHRLNSYPSSPYTVTWESKYGNVNETTVTMNREDGDTVTGKVMLNITVLSMTVDEKKEWEKLGITCPRFRDLEILEAEKNEETRFLLERSQFLMGRSPKEKMERLLDADLSLLENIREFAKRIPHGVKETVKVRDRKFDPILAVIRTRNNASQIRAAAAKLSGKINITPFLQQASLHDEEADKIQASIDNNVAYTPDEEEVAVEIKAEAFFPGI
jgi:hypothetical protein